jgi:NitT/TauT family transport system ATP-binding protein
MVFAGRDASQNVQALDNVSLEIRKGEFVCLARPFGLWQVHTACHHWRDAQSHIRVGDGFAGSAVTAPRPNDIAYVFQESTLLPWYTVLENFRLGLEISGHHGRALARQSDARRCRPLI